jgi:hypothetical protein
MNNWSAYDDGRSIGGVGSEGSVILHDDEHIHGARITLKRGDTYVSVSSNIYGWIDHTRFFDTIADAQREYITMKSEIDKIMEIITPIDANSLKGWEAISEFVRRFS